MVVGTYRLVLVVGYSQDGRALVVDQLVLAASFDRGNQFVMVVAADSRVVEADSQAVQLETDIQFVVVEGENRVVVVVVAVAAFVFVVDKLAVAVVVDSLALAACPAVVVMLLLWM